ncbi:MAG: hypothetical protein ACYSSL_08190 [Planctomycetota bacterium]|jgi:hypothetical protein
MPKFRFLLLDANIIIYAHELGIWDRIVERCSITITKTVVEDETYFWRDKQGVPHQINLDNYINYGKINCIDVPLSQVESFLKKFDPVYLERMDPGETDSLAFLYYHLEEKWLITSADGIVFRILGRLGLSDRGISLEEIVQKIGSTCNFDRAQRYTKKFRLSFTKRGEQDNITGTGLIQTK